MSKDKKQAEQGSLFGEEVGSPLFSGSPVRGGAPDVFRPAEQVKQGRLFGAESFDDLAAERQAAERRRRRLAGEGGEDGPAGPLFAGGESAPGGSSAAPSTSGSTSGGSAAGTGGDTRGGPCGICRKITRYRVLVGGRLVCEECTDAAGG